MRCAREIWHTYRPSRERNGHIVWYRVGIHVGDHLGSV